MAKSFLDQYEAYKKKRRAEEERAQQQAQKPKYNIPSTGTFAERYEAYKQQRMADERSASMRNNVNSPHQNPLQLANRRSDAIAQGTKRRQEDAARAAKEEETTRAKQADKQLHLDTVDRLTKQYMPSNGFEDTVFKLLNIERPEEKKPDPIPQVDINKKYGPESELPKRGAAIASAGASDAPFGFGKIIDLSGDGGSMSVRNSAMDEADRERMEQAERDRKDQTARDELDARIATEQRARLEREHTAALAKLYSGTLSSEEYAAQEALAGELADRLNGDDKRVDDANKPQNKPVNGWDYDAQKAQDVRRVEQEDELANKYQLPSIKPAVSQEAAVPAAKTLSVEDLQARRREAEADIEQYNKVLEWAPSPQNVEAYRNYIAAKVQKTAAEKGIQEIDQEIQGRQDIELVEKLKSDYSKATDPFEKAEIDTALKAAEFKRDWNAMNGLEKAGVWLGDRAKKAMYTINDAIYAIPDLIADVVGVDRLQWSNNNKAALKGVQANIEQQAKNTNWLANMAGDVVSEGIRMIPTILIASMTGGASLAAQGAANIATAGAGTGAKVAQATVDMLKNPAFVNSFFNMFGLNLSQAREAGVDPATAVSMSWQKALPSALIEMSGGYEKAAERGRGWLDWLIGSLEEGREEVIQGITDTGIDKTFGNVFNLSVDDIISLSNQEAIISAPRAAEEFGLGAATAGVMGGGQQLVLRGLDAAANANQERNINTTVGRIVESNAGPQAVADFVRANLDAQSKSAELAMQLGAKPSIGDIGKLTRTAREELTEKLYQATNLDDKTALIGQIKQLDELALGVVQQEQETMAAAQSTVETAREYGQAGIRIDDLIKEMGELPDEARQAYVDGAQTAKQLAAEQEANIKEMGPQQGRKGILRSISVEEASKNQVEQIGKITPVIRAATNALRGFAEDTGLNITLFDSPVNDAGQHVGKQGWYDRSTQTIYLDVNSGYGNEEAIMRSASHEITHFIKQFAPSYYENTYKQNVINALYDGDPDALMRMVNDQIRKAADNGKTQTISQAMDDVIADASETMLFGGQATLKKLVGENPKLFVRVKRWIDNFVKALQRAVQNIKADSEGAKLLTKSYDEFKKIQSNYWRAMQEASVNLRGEIQAEEMSAYEEAHEKAQAAKNAKIGTAVSVPGQAAQSAPIAPVAPAVPQSAPVAPVAPVIPQAKPKTDFGAMFEASINQDAVSNAPQEALDIVDDMKLPGDKPAVKKPESAAPSKTPLSEMMANKRYSTKFKNLAKKWAANEWVNIDLNKDSQDGYDFLKFAAKWYNGGRENLAYPELRVDPMFKDGGDRFTLVYDDRDTDYPNFLIDVFYKAGKAEAPKTEPVKAEKPAEKKPEQSKVQTPSEKLAGQLLSKLDSNTKFTSSELFDLADEAFGGTQSQGTYTVKDAYDALELAVNKRLLKRMAAQGMNSDSAGMANLALKEIGSIMDLLPTQTKRTAEQESFQQFSTPPNIAYLAAWAARISNNDFILEPSAGIGGLAVFAKAWGAEVAVNELSARRLEVLRAMGFDHMFNENAEQIDNILPDNIKPTVVIMNPPFSATAGRTASNKTSNAIRHIEQALSRLEPNGRLVAILGRGMADDTPTFRGWWNDLRKKYNIRANIGIDGSNYTKYGTSFDVQLVVIDKTGPQTGDTLTGTFKDLGNIPNAMEGIRNDRPITQTTERKPVVESGVPVTGTEGQRKPESATVPDRANTGITNPETDAVLDVPAAESAVGDGKRSGISEGAVQPTDNELEFGTDGRAAAQTGADAKPSKAETDGSAVREPSGQLDEQSEFGAGEPRTAVEQEIQDDGVFSTYVSPNIPVKAGKHPAVLVESSAMAAVSMPEATYVPKLPKSILKNLSTEQMVAITYAGQAFAQKLPTGEKKGFFVGDGTGVGKGRTISGIIADSFAQGQKKAVWITKSQKLLNDAIRDWGNTTGKTAKGDIIQLSKIKADAAVDKESGILFASFDTLRGGSKTNAEATRIKQIIDWLGADFDGVIVYDEAHNMANLVGKKTNRGKSSGSAKAIAGVELQRKFPNAGIVYTTATAAQEVSELAFAERLGLWGQGTPFADVNDFINSISSSGLAAMELVSREMKERGLYVARSISYEGVEYQTIKHNLDDVQREIYDTMSRAWQKVMQNVNQALEITDGKDSPGARAAAKSAFYGAVQRFYNQVLTSMSMPSVIRDMKAELENNRSIVIQIVTTNEAEQERQLGRMADEDISLEELDMTPRGALINYLEKSFPINQYEDYTDDNGNNASRPVFDSHGKPVINKEAVKMRDALIAEVQQMKVPQGPLEMLFDSFGTENVAEMTGRKRRVVPKKNDKGQLEYVVEKLSDSASEADAQAFQDGRKHILVFSDAGGTGKSYHADRTAKNQQQRVHYVLQPGWSAKNAVQGFGRTHRTNEASAPIYKLVTTDIKGQKRFVSTIARRLDQLGALTKGQRETGSGIFSSADNLESAISIDSLREFYNQLLKSRLNGLEPYNILEKMGLLDKFTDQFNGLKMDEQTARNMQLFLNRILALEVDEQNRVFENFELINSEMYEAAKEAGTLDEGLETIKAEKIEVVDDQLVKEYPGGGSTRYVQTKVYNKTRIEKSLNGIMAYRNNFMGLYKLDNGETRAVFRVANKTDAYGNIREQYRLMTPNLDGKYSTWNESTLQNRAALLDKKEWAAAWKAAADEMPEYNTRTMHLLTGSLLPVWDKLPMEGNIKVVRMNTDDGQSLLGRVIKPEQVDMTLNRMGYGRKMKAYSPSELFDAVLKENKVVKLEFNRISIQRSRVNNEQRLEIKGDNLWSIIKRFPDLFMEKIQYRERYFIPNSQVGRELIGKIVDTNRVTGVYEGEEDIDYSFRRITSPDFLKTEDKLDDRQLLIDALDETSSENQYSDRDPSRLTSREQLATAFEGISHTEADKQIIAQYKGKLEKVEADVQALREINAKIKELSFAPGKRDMDELARLKNNKVTLSNRIARNDSMLTRIENAQPMRQLIIHEKKKAENAIKTQEAQRMAEYRERMEGKVKEAKEKGKENLEKYKGKVSDRSFRAAIKEIAEELTVWINNPDKNARVPQVLRRVIGDFLLSLNLQSKRAIGGGDSTKADRELYERMNTLALTLNNINAFQNGEKIVEGMYQEIAGFFDMPAGFQQTLGEMVENIRKLLEDSSGDYVINRMAGEELEQLHYILKILRKSVTQMNKLLSNAAFEHVDTLGNRTIAEIEQIKRDNKKNGTAYRFFNWENTMPVYAFDRFGTGGKAVFESLQNGADRLSMIAAEIKNYAEKTFTAKESREWSDELHTFNLDGEQVKMTTWHLMGLYSMSQREQAKGHLYGEGIRVGNFQHKGQTISSKGHTLTPGKVQAMIGQLTARQKDVADKLQRFMNDRGGELGNQVTMVRFGVDMYEEKQYYPLESDKAHLASDTEGPEAGGLYRLLNLSFSKKLQKKANNRVMLYSMIDVFANHMSDMAQYNALALPVLDAVKWLNYQESITTDGQKLTDSVKDVMRDAFGDAANSYITHLLKDINGTRMTGDENAFAMKRLRAFNRAQVAANLRVALLQPLSIVRAGMVLSPGSITKGMLKNVAMLKKNMAEMDKYAGIAQWKQLGFYDVNLSRSMQSIIKQDDTLGERIADKSMWLPQQMDRITWAAIWQASKDKTSSMEEAAKLFRDTIYRTQVVDSILTRSDYMRNSSFLHKWTSSFMSEPTLSYNIVMSTAHGYADDLAKGMKKSDAWQKHGKKIARAVTVYAANAIVVTVMQALMSAWRDDDDYSTFLQKFAEGFKSAGFDNLNVLNLPLVNEMWEGGKRIIAKIFPESGIYGFDNESVITAFLDYFVDAVDVFAKHLNGEKTSTTLWGGAYKLLQGLSVMTGFPMASATREVTSVWNNTVAEYAPSLKVLTYTGGKSQGYENLYKALKADNEERIEQLRGTLTMRGADAKAVYGGLRDVVKEEFIAGKITEQDAIDLLKAEEGSPKNANDVYWLVQKWKEGGDSGYSKFDKMAAAVMTGEGLRAAMQELLNNGTARDDISSAITNNYQDLYVETYKRSRAEAAALKGRLLNAYVLLGYEREKKNKDIDKWLER